MKPFPVKFILYALLTILLISCDKDDDVKPAPVTGTVTIGGDQYYTVVIGQQTWTAENYNGAGGKPYNDAGTKPEYGKYYTYTEAMAIVPPAGWRLPKLDDFIKMSELQGVVFAGGRATKQDMVKRIVSVKDWLNINGNNASGFNAFPAGYMFGDDPAIGGDISEFWTIERYSFSIQESADKTNHNIVSLDNSNSNDYRFNVRFVKDN